MYEFLEYRVEDAMTRRPVVITRRTPLREIEEIFARNNFNTLPVVDSGGHLTGVVTKLDVLRAFLFTPQSMVPAYEEIMQKPAERVITWEPITVAPDEPLTRVVQKMVHSRCKSFPVVSHGLLVGIIAREDVLAALRRAARGERPAA